jgi:hypothetical protein
VTPNNRLRLSGVLAAILFAAGYLVFAVVPGGGDPSNQDFTDFYDDDAAMGRAFLLLILFGAGSGGVIWFTTELQRRIGRTLACDIGSRLAFAGALLAPAGAAIAAAPALAIRVNNADFAGMEVARAFYSGGAVLTVLLAMSALAAATILFSFALKRSGLVPEWLGIAGMIVGVLLLASFFWIPGFLFPIWMLAVAVFGFRTLTAEEMSPPPIVGTTY